jgi:N-methylhydantoinase A/oxoprolinase/acetone carboxylase beta subunit
VEFGLGIDAGGTYTDAVIVDFHTQQVRAKAKALTTKDDLSRGVAAAIGKLPHALVAQVQLVSLSTTLATNAIVEGKGSKVGALALGFDDYDLARVAHSPVRAVPGRMNITGHEIEPLDEAALRDAVRELLDHEQVSALAISGMVSVMNPAHEQRAREIVTSMTTLPVVCAHELSMQLDSIKRTVTAALNARLLPIIADLITHVKSVMAAEGIHAPLMVVRGDGTLMSEELARRTPVETILSGPAASVCGAQFLSGVTDGLVVDIGGTTSDIALLIAGEPVVAPKGARVADWSTNVRAIDIETVGLGGDSAITLGREQRVLIGPRRAIPLAYLAHEYPSVIAELRALWETRETKSELIQPVEFFARVGAATPPDLAPSETRTLAALAEGPLSREQLATRIGALDPSLVPVKRLETLGVVQRATLTPTDVLHVHGAFTAWSREAAELALALFAERAGVTAAILAEFILDAFSYWMTVHLMHRLIRHQCPVPDFPAGAADRALLDMLADRTDIQGLTLQARFSNPLVAIGAPAAALAGEAARKLGAQLIVPEHAEVANAVGAITGAMTITVEATITPSDDGYVAHSPVAMREFPGLEEAKAWASAHVLELLEARIALGQVEGVHFQCDVLYLDRTGAAVGGALFLECQVRGVAVGKREFAALAAG